MIENDPKENISELSLDTFEMMAKETESLFVDIQSAYDKAAIQHEPHELENLAVFVFGSPNRSELVKCGDIDAFIISDNQSASFRNTLYTELSKLNYDKLDIPPWTNFEPILELASTGSPEADYADARFVAGDPKIAKEYKNLGFLEYFTSVNHVLPKIVFHYFFWKHKYKGSSDQRGINLKYSEGATRDNLFFDWYYDLLQGTKSRDEIELFIPQIQSALKYFEDQKIFETSNNYSILKDISVVNLVKAYGLVSVENTSDKGEAYMKLSFAKRLFDEFPEVFGDYKNPEEFLREYNISRKRIREYKDKVFENIENSLENGNKSDPLINYCKRIIDIWRNNGRISVASIQLDLKHLDSLGLNPWYYLASILCQSETNPDVIDHIAQSYLNKPENEYLTRLIIKHPNSRRETLSLINNLPRLALAPQTEIKYRNIISKRLVNEKAV